MSNGNRDRAINAAVSAFRNSFHCEPSAVHFAPGRVNLIGEHTDYNDGFAFPVAIDSGTATASRPQSGSSLDVVAADYGCATESIHIDGDIVPAADGGWRNHVRGLAACYCVHTGQLPAGQLVISGNVPQGAGLSSSASLGVSLVLALAGLSGVRLSSPEIARIVQEAEKRFAGCDCGLMDPLISAEAQEGSGLLIDCRSLEWQAVPVPETAAILVAHSGVQRGLAASAYNDRRRECSQSARALGLDSLREATAHDLKSLESKAAGVVFRRARHVITENARTRAFARALPSGDLRQLGELLNASHASLRDDFEVTVPAVDRLVETAQQVIGIEGGARMTGGGFGGCIVAMCPSDSAEAVCEQLKAYLSETGIGQPLVFRVWPGQGAAPLR